MFIEPMVRIDSVFGESSASNLNRTNAPEEIESGSFTVPFQDTFEAAVSNVVDTETQAAISGEMLATGNSDDLHGHSIDLAKAQLSIDLLVELRNKALESYSEIIRMTV